jgi:hypothetical protein
LARWNVSAASVVPEVGDGDGDDGDGDGDDGDGDGDGDGDELDPPGMSAWKAVTVAVPVWVRKRMPQ